MMDVNFYFSGILYAKIREETEALTVRILDIETGNLGEERPFGEKENVFLQKLCSRSIAGFFEKKAACEEKIAQEPEVFTLDGERFTNRRRESYIQRDKKFPMDLFYENGKIPFSSVIVAIQIYATRFDDKDLLNQTFFNPYPIELISIADSGKGRNL